MEAAIFLNHCGLEFFILDQREMNEHVKELIAMALREDIQGGDITSAYFVPAEAQAKARVKVKAEGVLAGIEIAREVCQQVDPSIEVRALMPDGSEVSYGDIVMEWHGAARTILTAERTALNFLQRLSGIATKTHSYSSLIAHTECRLLDTRKTTPGWRWLEKMAVRAGGGYNHRMGLYDRAMVKDNHLVAEDSLQVIQAGIHQLKKDQPKAEVELEADTLAQVADFLQLDGVDYILLDNMPPAQLLEALALREKAGSQVLLEASGGVTHETIVDIAETGVDFVSVGALTHSAVALDISLDFIPL